MFYMLRKDSYIRKIGAYGYIKSSGLFNDLVFDESGQAFLLALSREPKTIEALANEIAAAFINVSADDIIEDVKEFFDMLVSDGYVVCGNTYEETLQNNVGFDYSEIKQITLEEDYTPKNIRSDADSQLVLNDYFLEKPYLSNFQIELTSRCNERCIHCYIPHEYKNSDISEELYYSVLDQLSEMGTLGITLSGGEPMAHPKFKEFLKAAKDRDFYVHVLSNLTLLDDETVELMKQGNICGVQVSLYSMIPEHHDTITAVKGSFVKTRDAILKLIENNIPVQISCPIMKANKDDAADVIKWGHEHKIRVNVDYAIMAEYNHETANLAHRLSPEECRDVIKSIIAFDEDYTEMVASINWDAEAEKVNFDEPFCGIAINTACMVANGNVYPCPGWQGYVCGNLNQKSLKDIWYSSDEMKYLRGLRKKDMKKCSTCKNRAFCTPCLGRFANESPTGNPLEVATHFCEVARVNREVVFEYSQKNK